MPSPEYVAAIVWGPAGRSRAGRTARPAATGTVVGAPPSIEKLMDPVIGTVTPVAFGETVAVTASGTVDSHFARDAVRVTVTSDLPMLWTRRPLALA